jgi:hypothetical protein
MIDIGTQQTSNKETKGIARLMGTCLRCGKIVEYVYLTKESLCPTCSYYVKEYESYR